MLNIPDLNRLRVFHTVFITRSLVRAAATLHVTRSAISQSLKALEDELQIKLFIRDSKRVLPTESAEMLFKSIDPFVAEIEATLVQLETGQKIPVGRLRIGAPQDYGSNHLTEAIVEFHKVNPRVSFELILATPVSLLEMASTNKIDLAFVDNGDVHAKNYPVSIVPVMKEHFIPVCSKGYFEKNLGKRLLKFADLKRVEFIDYLSHAPVSKMWIKHHFGKPPPDLKVSFSAESVRSLIRATVGGLGVCVLPEHLVEEDLESGRLKMVSSAGRPLINQITLARRLDRTITAREREFIEFFRRYSDRAAQKA